MAANSTLMFSGFNPNSRNSSKVLRPPGGGSSDIFGLKVDQEEDVVDPVQEVKDNLPVEDSTTTAEVSNTNDDGEPREDIQSSAETPSEESGNSPTLSTTPLPESASPSVVPTPSSSSDPSPTPPVAGVRGRIPPGGHSSGAFW
jgi:hypothetical protein